MGIKRKNGDLLPDKAIQELKAKITGENEAYIEEAAIIVFCQSEDDISECLRFVQQWDVDLAVAGGRHSYHGGSSTGGGLVIGKISTYPGGAETDDIDLKQMNKVVVDKINMTVTAQGGSLARDLEVPAYAEGLSVVMGGVNDTGIAGLTVGGGSGYLTGQYGHIADNLLAARVVLADGKVVRTSINENSDLFWALRGCGPNFGVVTEFTYRAHPQGPVFMGILAFMPDKLDDFIKLANPLQEKVNEVGGKLVVFMAFNYKADMHAVVPACMIFYDGPEEEGRSLTAPLFDLNPMMQMCGMKPYPETTVIPPGMEGPPTHQKFATKNMLIETPVDIELIKSIVEDYAVFMKKYGPNVEPSKLMLEVRSCAVGASVPTDAMAFAARHRALVMVVEAQYDDTGLTMVLRDELRTMFEKARDKLGNKGSKVLINTNISSGDEKLDKMFGDNLPRLKELKKKYDPNFIFNKWYPINPKE